MRPHRHAEGRPHRGARHHRNLLARFAGITVRLRWRRRVPAAWLPRVLRARGRPVHCLGLERYDELEPLLARLREAACEIDELELQQADLEEVFLPHHERRAGDCGGGGHR